MSPFKFQILFLICIFLLTNRVLGINKRAVYFGGVDNITEENRFIDSYRESTQNLQNRGWSVDSYFSNKNDPFRKKIETPQSVPGEFTQKTFQDKINSLIKSIDSGIDFKKGDELLIYIAAHGNISSSGQYNFKSSDAVIDIHLLKKLAYFCKKKDIKLGFIGNTCFSGGLLPLANDKTCVLTTAPSDQNSYFGAINPLVKNLSNNKITNLEDLFLQSRLNIPSYNSSIPQISSEAGAKTQKDLDGIKASLIQSEFLPLKENIRESDVTCTGQNLDYKRIDKLAENIQRGLTNSVTEIKLSPDDEDLVGDIKSLLYQIEAKRKKLFYGFSGDEFSKNHCFSFVTDTSFEKMQYSKNPLISYLEKNKTTYCYNEFKFFEEDFESYKSNANNFSQFSNSKPKEGVIEKYLASKISNDKESFKINPSFENWMELRQYLFKKFKSVYDHDQLNLIKQLASDRLKSGDANEMDSLISKLAEKERTLYNKIYHGYEKKMKGNNLNPCKDFTL